MISCSILTIATLLIRNWNEAIRPAQRGFDFKLLRRLDVALLLSWAFISMLRYISLLFSLPDYAQSTGLSDTQAMTVSAILNLGTAFGRPVIGIASDRYGRIEIAGLLTCACGISCFAIWIPATSYGVLVLFAFVSGAIFGVFWVVSLDCQTRKYLSLPDNPYSRALDLYVLNLWDSRSSNLHCLSWTLIVLPTTCELSALQKA
jgi:nitrate/nitrite transporter NarK